MKDRKLSKSPTCCVGCASTPLTVNGTHSRTAGLRQPGYEANHEVRSNHEVSYWNCGEELDLNHEEDGLETDELT